MKYLIAFALLLSACNPFGCEEKSQSIEVNTASPFFDSQLRLLDHYEKSGYDCQETSISGSRTLYKCTKCD